ncbi:alpha-tocopherol transfer protein-like [Nymphalis io]|uniref:alpha-tocopherol transfer protein-like n=1 Tax=Inachis io TaxID=171585 RepID=UPI00216A03C4|nr:alpha-tocopherol transfer protein-like [Nymphalis io]XP_050353566.1 alpha-tocopherol transfer protein-like [Nymphalis io]
MESASYNPLLKVSDEEIAKIRQDYNLDTNKIKENLDAIEEWCEKQNHLREAVQYLGRDVMERIHILAKGSVEGTKIKIDKILTTRGLIPEIMLNKSLDEFKKFQDNIIFITLPNLSPTCHSRIFVSQIINPNIDDFNFLTYLRYCFMIGEYRLHFEYSMSDRFIVDLKYINMNIITKINPILLKKGETLCTEAYGTKIKGIHFVHAPPYVDKIINLLKQVLKEKISSRVYVHSSYEDLHKAIPKEILPKEYGGDSTSCAKLSEQWKEYLKTEQARKILDISNKLISDESKRCSIKFNEEYLGMPGTFRRLNVD